MCRILLLGVRPGSSAGTTCLHPLSRFWHHMIRRLSLCNHILYQAGGRSGHGAHGRGVRAAHGRRPHRGVLAGLPTSGPEIRYLTLNTKNLNPVPEVLVPSLPGGQQARAQQHAGGGGERGAVP